MNKKVSLTDTFIICLQSMANKERKALESITIENEN